MGRSVSESLPENLAGWKAFPNARGSRHDQRCARVSIDELLNFSETEKHEKNRRYQP
jgi:hypothetical protein